MTQAPGSPPGPDAELQSLIRTIHQAEGRIAELTGGQVDAIVDPSGASYLLGPAQRRLRDDEADQRERMVVLNAMLDALPANIALLDTTGHIVTVNAAWRRFASLAGAEIQDGMVGEDYLAVCDRSIGPGSADAQAAAAAIRLVMAGELREASLEYPCHSPTDRQWFRMVVTPSSDGGGAVVMHIDVTQQVMAEVALRRSEGLYRAVFENDPQPIWVYDLETLAFLAVNEAAIRRYGYSRDEFLTMSIPDISPPGDAPAMMAWVVGPDSAPATPVMAWHRRKDGSLFQVEAYAQALEFDERPARLVLALDVTDRLAASTALAASERRTALILDSVDDGIFGIDMDGLVTFANAAAVATIGIEADGLIGRNAHSTYHHHRQDGAEFPWEECPTYQTLRDGQTRRDDDTAFFRHDGSIFPVEFACAPIVKDDGTVTGAVISFRNVTGQRALEERLRQAQRLESIGQLTGGVAHDFNNLLTVIIGNAGLLAEELRGDPERRALADMTLTAAQRAAELTKRLLAFARRQTLAPREVDATLLLAGMDGLLRRTLGEHIEIESTRAAGLWPALVDPAQLEGAILNLAINARDAMPAGGRLTIEAANARLDRDYAAQQVDVKPGQYVMIAISDSGSGIPPEDLERVFDPFFTTKEVGRGTGLGLSMVFGFVKQSGGHVRIYSEVGQGTTVRMFVPRSFEGAATEKEVATEAIGGTELILLVEDDDLVRQHAYDQLTALGYRVVTARNGPEAMAVVNRRADFDLLFTDVVMPGGMNGRALADAARAVRPDLPVLFTSGYTEDAIVHHGRLDPGVQFLSKPYGRGDLARAVRAALEA